MATIDNIVADLRKAIESAKSGKTQAYDTVATVKRVVGNTAWVQIPGGTSETPVQLTIACQPGDTVQVRVGGGRAWLTGNQSAPPTDDREAKVARSEASRAQVTASKAHEVAEEASTVAGEASANALNANQIASNTNQYFWHTESGDDTGAHITEKTQEEFLADPQNGGGNTIMRSNGMAVRDGLTEIASFGGNGSQIGKTGESHLGMDYHSMQLVDDEEKTYFHVSDLKSKHIASDEFGEGYYYIHTDTFIGDGKTKSFHLSFVARDTDYSVTIDGADMSGGTKYLAFCYINPAPADGAQIVIRYPSVSSYTKAYTLGFRSSNSTVGAMSVAEGANNKSSGEYSHAEGYYTQSSGASAHAEGYVTKANGKYSHAQNYGTIASKEAQTVIGRYNEEDTASDKSKQKALIIGNGTDDDNRSNAFSVDWNGNVKTAGEIVDGSGFSMPRIYVGRYNNWVYEQHMDSGLIKAWYDSGETTTTCTTSSGNGWYRNADAYKISLAGLELDAVYYATITANAGYAHIVTSLTSVTTTELRYYVGHLGSYSNRPSRIYAEVVGYKLEEE